MPGPRVLAPASLILAATIWGLVWYPYRVLQELGVSGSVASFYTYLLGIPPLLYWARASGFWTVAGQRRWLLAVALVAGWTNLSYVLAVIEGEVVRVMLLFYLAPLWTLLFSRWILDEHTDRWGIAVMALALGGAWVMLYHPDQPLPLPANAAEWLGLSSGMGFALTNVLTRKAAGIPIQTRSLWVFIGMVCMAGVFMAAGGETLAVRLSGGGWAWLGGISLALLLATFTVQYGLAHVPANRAIVLLLFELVVAALASLALTDETLSGQEIVGGVMILSASLLTLKTPHAEH